MGYKNKTVEAVVGELRSINKEVSEILKNLPTDDHHIIGRLYTLTMKQNELIQVTVSGKESRTMFLEQERRIATFLIGQYNHAVFTGKLHKSEEEPI